MIETSDAELLARVAGGESQAFAGLVSRHERAIFRLASTWTGDRADAEDILQETFLAAFRHAGDFRGEGSARAWFLTIARHLAMRRVHRQAQEPESCDSLEALGEQAGWGNPLPLAERLAERDAVAQALRALPPAEREILLLRDLEGLTGEEAAAELGLSLAAAKSRLHRARLHLIALIRGERHAPDQA